MTSKVYLDDVKSLNVFPTKHAQHFQEYYYFAGNLHAIDFCKICRAQWATLLQITGGHCIYKDEANEKYSHNFLVIICSALTEYCLQC